MMRTLFSVVTLLLVPCALTAQTASRQTVSTPAQAHTSSAGFPLIQSENCPVSLGVQRWSTPEVRKAVAWAMRPGEEPAQPQHGLYLQASTLKGSHAILSATAVLRGNAPGLQAEPVRGSAPEPRRETIYLASAGRDGSGRWKLTAEHVPLVREIDLTEIHFADGTTWHESSDSHCRAQPSGFLLVADR